jgi:hypothetical protein
MEQMTIIFYTFIKRLLPKHPKFHLLYEGEIASDLLECYPCGKSSIGFWSFDLRNSDPCAACMTPSRTRVGYADIPELPLCRIGLGKMGPEHMPEFGPGAQP